jgi:hypothetical protein
MIQLLQISLESLDMPLRHTVQYATRLVAALIHGKGGTIRPMCKQPPLALQ